jgi:peroxiredoxin
MKSLVKNILGFVVFAIAIAVNAQDDQPMLGNAGPGFELRAINGNTYSLEKLKGKFVVIHFAATWCPFCNAEAPHLEQLYRSYRDKGVEVFIIDVREEQGLVEKSLGRFNFTFPVLLDVDGKVSASYAPDGVQPALDRHEVPIASNLIIDKEGKIRFYSLLNSKEFDAKLTKLQQKLDELIGSSK